MKTLEHPVQGERPQVPGDSGHAGQTSNAINGGSHSGGQSCARDWSPAKTLRAGTWVSLPGWQRFTHCHAELLAELRALGGAEAHGWPLRAVSCVFPAADFSLYPSAGMNPNRDRSGITKF